MPHGGMKMNHLDKNDADEKLRAEFTRFLETMVRRAKINYLTKYRQRAEIISLDEVPEQAQPHDEIRLSHSQTEFWKLIVEMQKHNFG